jgi:hypothetical protein
MNMFSIKYGYTYILCLLKYSIYSQYDLSTFIVKYIPCIYIWFSLYNNQPMHKWRMCALEFFIHSTNDQMSFTFWNKKLINII